LKSGSQHLAELSDIDQLWRRRCVKRQDVISPNAIQRGRLPMIRTVAVTVYAVLFLVVAACSSGQQQPASAAIASMSLCQLLSQPEDHVDELVTLRVRLNIFRHGVSISDDACSKLKVGLASTPGQTESLANFDRFIAEHRQLG
jgi:hypothetical protein